MVKGILKTSQISKIFISKYLVIAFFLTLLFFFSSYIKAESYAVASRHQLATDIGMKVLEEAKKNGSDFFVLGRELTSSNNFSKMIKKVESYII